MSSDVATLMDAGRDSAIRVEAVGKCYRMYRKPSERLLHALTGAAKPSEFWALKGVSLDIRRGETFGIVGRNGSGKSTLLQIVAGTLSQTEGQVSVAGRIAALLELGSGFNPDFTGRENVYLNATILGLSRREIDERMQSILDFAGIGDFIDQPVRSYSSGMSVRLAFAVIVHVDADVLIVDEALSVGDAFFSQKCMRFLREFQRRGTLLFVSHDAAAVTNLCDRAVWLDKGTVQAIGDAKEVVEQYMAQQHADSRNAEGRNNVKLGSPVPVASLDHSMERDIRAAEMASIGATTRYSIFQFDEAAVGSQFGTGLVSIKGVQLLAKDSGEPLQFLDGGELVRLRISCQLESDLQGLILGFYVKDRLGQRLFGDNTYFSYRHRPVEGRAGDVLHADFVFRMPIMPSGSYMVDVAVASGDQDDHTQHHWMHDALEFRTTDTTMRHGLVGLPMLGVELIWDAGQ